MSGGGDSGERGMCQCMVVGACMGVGSCMGVCMGMGACMGACMGVGACKCGCMYGGCAYAIVWSVQACVVGCRHVHATPLPHIDL